MSTFLLLHGAWHDSRCWELLTPLLQAQGHAVIAPDLPGHGSSALAPARATMKAYVQCVLEMLEHTSTKVILVGHSMAGMVITEVATKAAHKIERLVYLCAYLPQPGDSVFALIARNRGHEPLIPIELAMEMSADKRTCFINDADIMRLFYSDTAADLAEQARSRFAVQGSLPLAASVNYDLHKLAALPRTYICCSRDRVIPLHHQRRMLSAHEGIEIKELSTDHSPFFSCPAQLSSLLVEL